MQTMSLKGNLGNQAMPKPCQSHETLPKTKEQAYQTSYHNHRQSIPTQEKVYQNPINIILKPIMIDYMAAVAVAVAV